MANILKKLTGFSFLLVLTLSFLFLYAQTLTTTGGIFGDKASYWNLVYTTYGIILLFALIVGYIIDKEAITKLASVNYWRAFVLRIPVFIVAITVLILIKAIILGPGSINFLAVVSYLPIAVLIFHIIVATQIEEILFGGVIFTIIQKKTGITYAYVINAILFAFLWHYSKSGGSISLLLLYVPLRLTFDYVRNNGLPILSKLAPKIFGATPDTQQANAFVHLAWNLFVVGFR